MSSDKEILKRAIERAVENGFDSIKWMREYGIHPMNYDPTREVHTVIFSHDFAKAFWGDEDYLDSNYPMCKEWEYHLMVMVREPEPLKYLEKFL